MRNIFLTLFCIFFFVIFGCNNQRQPFHNLPKRTGTKFVTLEEKPYTPSRNIEFDVDEDALNEQSGDTNIEESSGIIEVPIEIPVLGGENIPPEPASLLSPPPTEGPLPAPPPAGGPQTLPPPPPIPEDGFIEDDLFLLHPPPLFSGIGCGNGIVRYPEQCDDNNTENKDGCNNFCLLPFCGNCVTDAGEECDDCNEEAGDGCNNCFLEYCGNKYVDIAIGEECEDGNNESGDGCSPTCQKEYCGNEIVDPGEQCDGPNTPPGTTCTSLCQIDVEDLCQKVCVLR